MRIALVIVAALALSACGKKKSPQTPASTTEQQLDQDASERNEATPDDADEAPTTRSADPQEGGE